jgi:hypothetical protein
MLHSLFTPFPSVPSQSIHPISAHASSIPQFSRFSFFLLTRVDSHSDRKSDRMGNARLELLPFRHLVDHVCVFRMGQISSQTISSESPGKLPSRTRVYRWKPRKPRRTALLSPQKLEESLSTNLLGNRRSTDSDRHHHRFKAIGKK